MGITIAATIFVFSLIVFVHEFGHFFTAKLSGMQVDEFAIGFGPKIYSIQYGSTLYSLRAIPLGGFNRIQGMSEQEEMNERSFLKKKVRYRLIVIAAGAAMNFILAIVLIWGVMFTVGSTTVSTEPVVGSIVDNSAAANSGMKDGDRIVSIGGTPIHEWSDISKAVAEHSRSVVTVVVNRDGKELDLDMVPKYDHQARHSVIGVVPVITKETHSFFDSAYVAVVRTGEICKLMITGMYGMIVGTEKADLAGPIGVAQLAGQIASVGFINLLLFTAFLSINLGILNLLPIPMLDGGYIILLLIEAVTGHRMPQKALYYIQIVGMVLLGLLFLFAMVQDFNRLF